jgi:hypothetical protein
MAINSQVNVKVSRDFKGYLAFHNTLPSDEIKRRINLETLFIIL